jgi:Outer membrane protein beta-barrel domain
MPRVLVVSLFFFVCVASSPSLFAGDATIYTGFQNPGKLTIDNVVRDTKLGAVVGGRVSVGGLVGFEQTFAYSPDFLESGNHAYNIQSNLLVTLPTGRISPYGTAGIGLITTGDYRIFDYDNFGTKFTINYGGGVKFRNLAGPIGLRFDLRGYSVPKVFDQTLNFIEGTIGIILSW